MNQEEIKLWWADLCCRLPYGVKIETDSVPRTLNAFDLIEGLTPKRAYLRPMDSMTDEERDEIVRFTREPQRDDWTFSHIAYDYLDWLNTRHLDYRGLIKKGLALEAPEGMYGKAGA